MSEADTDVVIVGGSAAGLSAALMLGRARRRVLVIDSGQPRNRFAAHMHGVLGREGTDPRDLVATGRTEAQRYGVEVVSDSVQQVEDGGRHLTVTSVTGRSWSARALVVASGVTDRLPDIPGLAARWGTSVLHCPYCHGWEVRDRRLGVLTTGPMSVHYAQFIRQWSEQITFFTADAGPIEPEDERRLRARGITIVAAPVVEVLGEGDQVTGVRTADGTTVALDAIFAPAATEPRDDFLAGLDLTRSDTPFGAVLAVDSTGKTSHDRIWAAGNVTNQAENVPMAISAGAVAGASVNMALITEDVDAAVAVEAAAVSR